ncbi:MAG: response regulator [Deltaproteobacteria bacterium]|nr:response regulator [Deltaproteobacteria bacterium]
MPAKSKKRLTQLILAFLAGVSLLSILLMGSLWVYSERRQNEADKQRLSEDFYSQWRTTVGSEVSRMAAFIDESSSENQLGFLAKLKESAYELDKALTAMEESLGGSVADDEIKQVMAAYLSGSASEGGKERPLVIDLAEDEVLTTGGIAEADLPAYQDVLESVRRLGEAFYGFDFEGAEPGEDTLSYLMLHPSLDWAVGVTRSLSAFEAEDEAEVLDWVKSLSFPETMNVVILAFDGEVMVSTVEGIEGNVFLGGGTTDFRQAAAAAILGAREHSSGDISFTYRDLPLGKTEECLGHYRDVAGRNWVILGWVGLDSLERGLSQRQAELLSSVNRGALQVAMISLGIFILVLLLYRFFARSAERSLNAFFEFFDNASGSTALLEPEKQPFREFAQLAEAANRMIVERKRAEELLRENEAKFRSIFEVSPQVVTVLDESLGLIEANSNFAQVFGIPVGDALGRPLCQVLGVGKDTFQGLDKGNGGGIAASTRELEYLHPSGRKVDLLFLGTTLKLAQRDFILGIFIDITSRKQVEREKEALQERLSRAQAMETTGLMASEVAHELNNILSGIVGYPELLLKEGKLDPSQSQIVAEIHDAGKRAAAVVADLLTLAKGAATRRQRLDLTAMVRSSLDGQRADIAAGAKGGDTAVEVTEVLGKPVYVLASLAHLRKSVDNLLANAFRVAALNEGGGKVGVAVSEGRLSDPVPGFENAAPGDYAILEVSDNGGGIPQEDQARIFEPFYTGKGWGGRGLGLTVVANTVRDLNGAVGFESSKEGTTFRVYLPKAEPPKKASAAKAQDLERYKGSGETVLVVDDVDIQRKLAAKMLTTLGYVPKTAASGEEAVAYLKGHDADLLILDMIMRPGMNGRETYEAVLSFKPGQKAIIASGMAEGEEVEKARALGATNFILKPYAVIDLAKAIRRALGAPPDLPSQGDAGDPPAQGKGGLEN